MAELVVLAIFAIVVIVIDNNNAEQSVGGSSSAPSLANSPSPSPERAKPKNILVTLSWPLTRGCDGGTMIAMPSGGAPISRFQVDGHEREQMIAAGAGVWSNGTLYLDLSAKSGEEIRIQNIRPILKPARLPPPQWIYAPGLGCGGPSNRVFKLDLDEPSLVDRGIITGTSDLDPVQGQRSWAMNS